jgi:hypothetical protein
MSDSTIRRRQTPTVEHAYMRLPIKDEVARAKPMLVRSISRTSCADFDMHDFRRHSEPHRHGAGAEPSRNNHVPAGLHDVPVCKPPTVSGRDEARPEQRNADLAAMGVACQRQAHARRDFDEDVRLVRQEDHGMVRRHLAERARQIVLAAENAAADPVRQLVPKAGDPEPGAALAQQNGPVFKARNADVVERTAYRVDTMPPVVVAEDRPHPERGGKAGKFPGPTSGATCSVTNWWVAT